MRVFRTNVCKVSATLACVLAWFVMSNHCALGRLREVLNSKAQATDACPHCPSHKGQPAPGAMNECCKGLRVTVESTKPFQFSNRILGLVDFAVPAPLPATAVERPAVAIADTGPPGGHSFAETVLQRSLLAHAPAVRVRENQRFSSSSVRTDDIRRAKELASCARARLPVCHADNQALLQREPTAFHADIGACAVCHQEHQGRVAGTTKMDHVALARLGLQQVKSAPADDPARAALIAWLKQSDAPPLTPHLQPAESLLNCANCHSTKDHHFGLFGADCASCHGTAKWTIPEFRHPSSSSQSCAQCHQAPPSHYMGHFNMISMKIAGQPHARVDQCFLCHQTTAWNDIRGVGWYKHH